MAAALEGCPVTYEDLADIEMDFEEAENETIRQQATLTLPLYEKRSKATSQIPNFWPLVFEQCPPDIDQYIQPSDSALIMNHLTNFSVSRFEAATGGDVRSLAIKFEFSENEFFSNTVLEKKLWYRRAKDGWSGLVSEPVKIDWKSKEKDLTGGLLDLVVKNWEAQKAANGSAKAKGKKRTPEQEALMNKIEGTGMGGLSFFAWFGFIGRRISAEESKEADAEVKANREKRKNGEAVVEKDEKYDEIEEDFDQEELEADLEIFPDGDDVAVALSEDLWVGALRYFTQAQEQDSLSDMDFESGDDDFDLNELLAKKKAADSESEDENEDEKPKKKARKA